MLILDMKLRSIINNYELIGATITLLVTLYILYSPNLEFDSKEIELISVGNPILDYDNQSAIYKIDLIFQVSNTGFKTSNTSRFEVIPMDDINDFKVISTHIENRDIEPLDKVKLKAECIVKTTRFEAPKGSVALVNSFQLIMFIYDRNDIQITDIGFPSPIELNINQSKNSR